MGGAPRQAKWVKHNDAVSLRLLVCEYWFVVCAQQHVLLLLVLVLLVAPPYFNPKNH